MTNVPKIELSGVMKSFGSNHVLRGVDLSVGKGESVVIIGGSGTGKSVTLKCILGLMSVDKGTIKIDGKDATNLRRGALDTHQAKFGMLFQGSALFDSLPVWRNVAFKLVQAPRITYKEAKERAIETLASVGLTPDIGDLYPAELSGGMQKRVALARAI
ncbi:MAG: ATP-binding cassette domain-containing protein, partial [Bdellovibrionales bacterium]